MNVKILLFSTSAVAAAIGGWFFLSDDPTVNGSPTQTSSQAEIKGSQVNKESPGSNAASNVLSNTDKEAGNSGDTEKMSYGDNWCNDRQLTESAKAKASSEHKQWLRKHGYLLEEKEVYKSYSESTLKELGETGDLTALEILAESESRKTRMAAAWEAAVHGSTGTAIMPLVVDYEIRARKLKNAGNRKEAKEMLLKSFAWQEFAAIRGDYTHIGGTVHRLQKGNTVMSIEPEDFEKISSMAKQLYREINQERRNRNLPAFSDNPPKVVENLNSLLLASFEVDGWDGWGAHLPSKSECIEENVQFLTSTN